ncbi:polysaccharide biosynthesis C-terminal domain-containing protein [Clostridium thermarum]|uniref:oligosaccharide flippase family protein n=1 Tax=Clostridium thermarum TaxID=1716543 RepID=UPI00112243F4|nr:polysaccharide biosynthesis C-terminal domain-containing protein [Clostridium thermarum]
MFKDSMILTLSKGIRGILVILFTFVMARKMPEDVMGVYNALTLVTNLLAVIFIFGFPTTLSYYYKGFDKKRKEELVGNTLLVLVAISLIMAALLIPLRGLVSSIGKMDFGEYYIFIILYSVIMVAFGFLENLYVSADKTSVLGKIYIIYIIISFSLNIAAIAIFNNLWLLLEFMIIVEAVRSIVMLIIIIRMEKIKLTINKELLIKQIKFSIPLGIVAIVQNLNMFIDNFFIMANFTEREYAIYSNAAKDIPLVGIITVSIATVLLPSLSQLYKTEKNPNKLLETWGKACEKTAVIMFPIFWILLFFNKGYVIALLSEKYIESAPIFVIYLIKFPLYFTVFGNILVAIKKQKYTMYNMIIGIVVNITLNYLLIQKIGFSGPAYSNVIVQYLLVFLQIYQISRFLQVPKRKLLPYRTLAIIFIVPSIISAIAYLIASFFKIDVVVSLFVFGIIIYSGSLLIYSKLKLIDIKEYYGKLRGKTL